MRNDHTDAEIARREHDAEMGAIDTSERRWLQFCADAKHLLGVSSLDGDSVEDGYSLDDAHDCFERGMAVKEYVEAVKLARQGLGL